MIRHVKIQATKDKTYATILLKQCENEKADRNKHINTKFAYIPELYCTYQMFFEIIEHIIVKTYKISCVLYGCIKMLENTTKT